MTTKPVLIDGNWVEADAVGTFQAMNPNTREPMDETYPVSGWGDLDRCLNAATGAAEELRLCPGKDIAAFLEAFAEEIESVADELVEMAHHETALPVSPRLKD
ncbi:MAG: aldehyde dehydrogenase family protein, partial [Planctomycetota bacterium]|nr:aldehyde dehydrogenase family protein [Planctomycetota bacterium]